MPQNPPGKKRVTIADVAHAAGLSTATVSHALNGIGQVNHKTKQRVQKIAARLEYRPNVRARRLRTGRSHAIALLSSMPPAISTGKSQLGFFTELAMGIAQSALQHGYVLSLVPPTDQQGTLTLLDIDGAIVLEPAPGDPIIKELEDRDIPCVTIGGAAGPSNIDLYTVRVADISLTHLLDSGAQSLGLIVGSSGRESQRVFRETYDALAAKRGFAPMVETADEEGGEQAGFDATLRLLANHPELDALWVPIDTFASGAARAAAVCGRTVGRDLLLMTRYDGLRAQTCEPALTAVDLHLGLLSQAAIASLLAILDGRVPEPPGDLPPPKLVIRTSTLRGRQR
jgi:DNA-binding LacI/PurR family transcriptional regulator